MAPKRTVLDLIQQTNAWQRLNEIMEEKHYMRDDVISFVHTAPMSDILQSLFASEDAAAEMAADPELRASVENAVASFDTTLSEEDLSWMAELMDHVSRHSASFDDSEDGGAASAASRVGGLPKVWGEALVGFKRAPSPGAAQLLAAAKNFWSQDRVDRFLDEAQSSITPASAAAVRGMIRRLHQEPSVRAAALQTLDVLELALPPAEMWAMAGAAGAQGGEPLDFHDFMDDDFLDKMRDHLAPC